MVCECEAKTHNEVRHLRIQFEDDDLRRLAEDPAFAPPQWGRDLVRAYRKKIQALQSATDERDLYEMKSLRLKRLKGNLAGISSIRLNDQFRIRLKFQTDSDGRIVIIIAMGDFHD